MHQFRYALRRLSASGGYTLAMTLHICCLLWNQVGVWKVKTVGREKARKSELGKAKDGR